MDRVAIFVDAGYIFATGAILLFGQKLTRGQLNLDIPTTVEFLAKFAVEKANLPLLRIYWYDGTGSGPTTVHLALAHTNNVKVRLGIVNLQGEQKGVDSLIVTDMISLARNKAMSAAILITGDEDMRVGVQQAQEFGVRVHLVGIKPYRQSQSTLLLQEADVCHELEERDIQQFLSIRAADEEFAIVVDDDAATPVMVRLASAVWPALSEERRAELRGVITRDRVDIPRDFDRILLKQARNYLGRDLTPQECKELRQAFKDAVQS